MNTGTTVERMSTLRDLLMAMTDSEMVQASQVWKQVQTMRQSAHIVNKGMFVGAPVWFTDRHGRVWSGTVTGINKKTVSVKCEDMSRAIKGLSHIVNWKVPPSMLTVGNRKSAVDAGGAK